MFCFELKACFILLVDSGRRKKFKNIVALSDSYCWFSVYL